jgi:hypothetical protein
MFQDPVLQISQDQKATATTSARALNVYCRKRIESSEDEETLLRKRNRDEDGERKKKKDEKKGERNVAALPHLRRTFGDTRRC